MTPAACAETVDAILGEEVHLRRLARCFVRCESDGDDLVQDTMLRAYRARGRFRPGSSMRAWTTTILRRRFLTSALNAKRRRTDTDTDAGDPLEQAPERQREEQDSRVSLDTISERLDGDVKRAFDELPELYRVPFYLSAVEQLTCAEIGARLGVPLGTAMSRIYRARHRLRVALVYDRPARTATSG